ncbi:43128_t:CDS:2, partial [Gigaspora margarita]
SVGIRHISNNFEKVGHIKFYISSLFQNTGHMFNTNTNYRENQQVQGKPD